MYSVLKLALYCCIALAFWARCADGLAFGPGGGRSTALVPAVAAPLLAKAGQGCARQTEQSRQEQSRQTGEQVRFVFSASVLFAMLLVLLVAAVLAFCLPAWASISIILITAICVAVGGVELLAKAFIAGGTVAVLAWIGSRTRKTP